MQWSQDWGVGVGQGLGGGQQWDGGHVGESVFHVPYLVITDHSLLCVEG